MLDFLFRFSVLNMAFSVIAKEIGQKLGSIGGPWFRCIYLWTLYLFFSEWWNQVLQFQVSTVAAGCFLVAYIYPVVTNLLKNVKYLNLLNIGFVRYFSENLMKLSFPLVLWRYVWGPLVKGLKCSAGYYFHTDSTPECFWFTRGVAVVLLCIIVSLCCKGSNPTVQASHVTAKRHRVPPPVPKRPQSTRTQALEARQKMRPRSANGK
ncbi:uncharacterized protein LOC123552037 [Mercenaria mercenaria]|uniref:uncharacterized protein LOC123552037 n=1 Tax=Mercenaria mercenaria TaxID=6596 RepID=UPI00234F9BBD|nr:uncharacterized protein LOC123552037 [Mercenaria mercenaria]